MKTLHCRKSIGRSLPRRCGFVLIPLAFACFALAQNTQAALPPPPPDGGYPGGNTAEGNNALFNVNTAVGINNTAVGANALRDNTTGHDNVAVGSGALANNITGSFNMAVGTAALLNNTANFNLAIGFRVGFMNTTGNHLTGIGAAAMRNNTTGGFNTAIGADALRENMTGTDNTAIGADALSTSTGEENTAVGSGALSSDAGGFNTAVGFSAMADASGGNVQFNTAVGWNALVSTTANANVAVGDLALQNDTSGFFNVAIGAATGINQTTGNNNIYIGQGSFGVAGESNTCYIQSIFGQLSTGGAAVFVNSAGKLGTTTSSKRFKENIKAMDKASEALFALKPVTFRYKKEIEPKAIPQWGLVAEDVEKVNPDLVIRDAEGKVNTVRYDQVYNMMLNEFLKEHKKVQELEATVGQQQKGMEALIAQVREQAAQIQKVSAQMKMNKPAPQVVANSE